MFTQHHANSTTRGVGTRTAQSGAALRPGAATGIQVLSPLANTYGPGAVVSQGLAQSSVVADAATSTFHIGSSAESGARTGISPFTRVLTSGAIAVIVFGATFTLPVIPSSGSNAAFLVPLIPALLSAVGSWFVFRKVAS